VNPLPALIPPVLDDPAVGQLGELAIALSHVTAVAYSSEHSAAN
jgi:hypothetical protein